jgi:hypothetical protein
MATPRRHVSRALLAAASTGLALSTLTSTARAAPPEPTGPHPRLWLDATTRSSMKALAQREGNAISRAVRQCNRLRGSLRAEARNRYMGLDWAAHTSNCAIAYQATGETSHAETALHFFNALLDDWETVGDGKGGDAAARHDSGYAIRAFGVHAAIAYDFLHSAPGMTQVLLAKARRRFRAWTDWYDASGYRARHPGTNYHAGYLTAVTLMAIAQGGEAGADGTRMWRHVADDLWSGDMKRAAARGAVLDGGDWGEGWQYAPLAVAGYAVAARAMIQQGLAMPEYERWADQLVVRHVHALVPSERGTFVGGDTQVETPSIPPSAWTLAAVVAGPSSPTAASWAKAELARLHLTGDDRSFLLYEALAAARGVEAAPFPRETSATMFLARGNGTLYARSSWSPAAAWMAMQCTRTIDVDHLPANAGNFVLARGSDELVVDPSPYGSLTSLTSNAPSVESAQLPADYKPSQAYWSQKTGYTWARQTESAVVAARCDYADQYRFQERPSDVPMAMRDVVLVPSGGGNATAVVVDRARTGGASRSLFLRFRTKAGLALASDGTAAGSAGGSSLRITPILKSSGTPEVRQVTKSDCFSKGTTRGNCSAARFSVQDYVLTVKGEDATAVHVLDLAGAGERLTAARLTSERDHRVVSFERGSRRAAVIIAASGGRAELTYRAAPGHHVVLDAPSSPAGRASVTAARAGTLCAVTVTPASSGGLDARPLVVAVSDTCAVTEDPTQQRPVVASLDGAGPAPAPNVETRADARRNASSRDELFAPAPDAVLLPPHLPRAARARNACGCTSVGRTTTMIGGTLALVAAALLVARRRR